MITVSVIYPTKEGSTFDMNYYLATHMPMVKDRLRPALRGVTVDQGVANAVPGAPLPFVAMCHLRFDSVEAFQAAFATHGAELQGDIPNYTNIAPVIQISEVKIHE
jgi:uncharacterized protein (TIGR02118 family)